MKRSEIAERVARRYDERFLQGYVRWKLRSDPVYVSVLEAVRDRSGPLVDVGCGVGLLAFYLREGGFAGPIIGVDFDPRKVARAREAARAYTEIDFIVGDARDPFPNDHDLVMLDVLQYMNAESQQAVLGKIAATLAPGRALVMRQGLRDASWRHRITKIVDALGRIGWNRGEALTFPTRDELLAPFSAFRVEVRPLWGRTPFNNYFFVITRPG